ncbi:MAG: UDP-N-acetylglucosamine--N-acetylmuramyl-(pentapeptide) pyrophosphoryl-undecaprenol N-acetylglucosamine transferase [Clostridia bacterium]|nr:UDP-N-acetylglucosamine--N-acetylmuramyl-(pentapeptide) pyrophosphoryl-undecaprenol N-acetylglucosamine transferase [Clostridia bacterium]
MKKILFCGGGSAGHVMPNIALCHDLKGKYITEYAGTDGIERGICLREGIRFYPFDGVKLVRGKVLINLTVPLRLLKAYRQAKNIIKISAPDAVFCKGGYASLPPALAAKRAGIPVFTHESDLSAGLANKIISGLSVKTFTSFPETAEKFKNGMYSGSPIRTEVLNCSKENAKLLCNPDGRKTILVFGGGSGASAINKTLREIIPPLCKNYNILHICGKGNVVKSNISGYKQYEFIADMGAAYAAADCAVARSGSNSAFELIANKIPTLFIPLENKASRGDQLQNANYFKNKGLCRVLRQKDLTKESLLKEIYATVNDEKLRLTLEKSRIYSGNEIIIRELERTVGR